MTTPQHVETAEVSGAPGPQPGPAADRHFLVASQPRTGSNNFTYCLNAHPDIRCGNELLHPLNGISIDGAFLDDGEGGSYQPLADEAKGHWARNYPHQVLENLLDGIGSDFTGFKAHLNQLWPACRDELLLTRGYRTIILHRENRLQQCISNQISVRTGVWHAQEKRAAGFADKARETLPQEPLDIDHCRAWLRMLKERFDDLLAFLAEHELPYFMLSYEEFFVRADFDQQLKILNDVYDFLGFRQLDDLRPAAYERVEGRIRSFLDSSRQKMNPQANYHLIPNIHEIERELASEEVGSLFA